MTSATCAPSRRTGGEQCRAPETQSKVQLSRPDELRHFRLRFHLQQAPSIRRPVQIGYGLYPRVAKSSLPASKQFPRKQSPRSHEGQSTKGSDRAKRTNAGDGQRV